MCSCCFFFQAEDGIRDLVRSRGLGDVYKRQVQGHPVHYNGRMFSNHFPQHSLRSGEDFQGQTAVAWSPVSYTHLTLPTSDLV